LLHDTPSGTTEYGRILAEIALDRIQFVSWNRRYDHPWLQQALAEAEEAGGLLTQPYDRLHAHYAQVAVASLSVPRHLDQFQERMRKIKQDLILIPGVKRLQEQLVANDLVKSLSPEAAAIVLPSPSRSPEVLDVAVHANPPKQDILWQWDFDQDEPWRMPTDFVAMGSNEGGAAMWQVHADQDASRGVNRLVRSPACSLQNCVQLLVVSIRRLAVYVDGTQVAAVDDPVLPQEGRVGLIALGPSAGQFDGLHVLDLVSNRTFSQPAPTKG